MRKIIPVLFLMAGFITFILSCDKGDADTKVAVSAVSISQTTLALTEGESASLSVTISPSNATNKNVLWVSSDPTVAAMNNGTVTGIKAGIATIIVTTEDGEKTATCRVTVIKAPVDLGLSVKWATCNIDATSPEQYGRYFAWGDIVGQTRNGFSWSGEGFHTYPLYELDAGGNLKPEYDAAHVLLGGTWRMPTKAEWSELTDNCKSIWTDNYNDTGVAGMIFASNKVEYIGKSIFLPAAGYGYFQDMEKAGSDGNYWSSTVGAHDKSAFSCSLSSKIIGIAYDERNLGLSVRPVKE